MRIASWVSALVLAAAAGCVGRPPQPAPQPSAAPASAAAAAAVGFTLVGQGADTALSFQGAAGALGSLHLTRDAEVAPTAAPLRVERVGQIGQIKPVALIVLDTYPSIAGGMSYCQAGEEQFLRVIALADPPPRETLRIKTASCRGNIELASPGIAWSAQTRTLRIDWLFGPTTPGQAESREIRFGADGRVLTP